MQRVSCREAGRVQLQTKPTGPGWKAPTLLWVAEVLSPSTAVRDRGVKLCLFARAGVKETCLVDPETYTVDVHDLERSRRRVSATEAEAESDGIPRSRVAVSRLFA